MEKNTLGKAAVVVIAGVILVPLAWNYIVCPVVNGILVPITNALKTALHKKKLQKGLKEGSIVYFKGKYYMVPDGMGPMETLETLAEREVANASGEA
jgi:hypothetical protein